MPAVQGAEVPVAGRHIPPRSSSPSPPQNPVDHLPVIEPPAPAARRPVRQQRLQPRPFGIGQVMPIEHGPGLPDPPAKIRETRPRLEPATDETLLAPTHTDPTTDAPA